MCEASKRAVGREFSIGKLVQEPHDGQLVTGQFGLLNFIFTNIAATQGPCGRLLNQKEAIAVDEEIVGGPHVSEANLSINSNRITAANYAELLVNLKNPQKSCFF